ncbi:MAG: glucose-1-phosphate adenylyltransferase [Oscillospiraceae bacterium]|nr:glucose-1-phosphate adenylyltransferase [Oscillospiraceae bacterium]
MRKEIVCMILAGGKGTRLGALTKKLAKPAVHFGGKYRLIDFVLSNCANSDMTTVGVLTQYEPLVLNSYIGIGRHWDLDRTNGGVAILPPSVRETGGEWYKGTGDAIYQNMDYIENFSPDYVLVLGGDHIYKMDYNIMLDYHKEKEADVTIAVIEVPMEEAPRFGILNTNEDGSIYEFDEKPEKPKNNLASMGIYIFTWNVLKKYLIEDATIEKSKHDFGKNILPAMLREGRKMFSYKFDGYWKDVGTIQSLWEANMDLLQEDNTLKLYDSKWRIYSQTVNRIPQYIGQDAIVKHSMIYDGCIIHGTIENSVIFPGVRVDKGAVIKNSVIMPYVHVAENASLEKVVVDTEYQIGVGEKLGNNDGDVLLVARDDRI